MGLRCGGNPTRRIATLEALAIFIGVKLWRSEAELDQEHRVEVMPTLTDNRGNGFALRKLYSPRHPLCAVVMELSEEVRRRRILPAVRWLPLELNEEADALSRGVVDGFSPGRRIVVDFEKLPWHLLPGALKWSKEVAFGVEEHKKMPRINRTVVFPRKRRKTGEMLRFTVPWDG